MNPCEMTRRRVLAGAVGAGVGLGALVSNAGAQQRAQVPTVTPQELGVAHRDMLARLASALGGSRLDSREGLYKIVDLLVEFRIVPEAAREPLRRLIDAILDQTATLETMAEKVKNIYSDAAQKAGDVAATIASIARASIEYAKTLDPKVDGKTRVDIIPDDVIGAFVGAGALIKVGPPALAVFGALAGAVAMSSKAAFGSKRP